MKTTGKHTPEVIEQFWRLLSEGYSYKEIERRIGVSKWTCVDWARFKTQPGVNMRMARKYGVAA